MVVRIKKFFVISLRGHRYTIVVRKEEFVICFVAAVIPLLLGLALFHKRAYEGNSTYVFA